MKRFNDLEFRWTQTIGNEPKRYPEIVRWMDREDGDSSCYTLLYWVEDKEGWYIKFVGDRPFHSEDVDQELVWELMRYGQAVMDANYRIDLYMKERSW